VSKLFM